MVELAQSPVQRLERAAHVAGSRGDPFRELIEAQCEVAAAILERQVTEPLSQERVNELAREATRQIVTRVWASLQPQVALMARDKLLRTAGVLALGGLACAVGGFFFGRWSVDRQLLAIQDAAFFAQVAQMNPAEYVRGYCWAHMVEAQGGGEACNLPLVRITPPTGGTERAALRK